MRPAIVYGIVTWDKHKLTVPEVFAIVNSAQFLLVSIMANELYLAINVHILEVKSFRAPRHTRLTPEMRAAIKSWAKSTDLNVIEASFRCFGPKEISSVSKHIFIFRPL